MTKTLIIMAALAALLAASAAPARAADQVNECPADFQLVASPEPHLADANGDRAVCGMRLSLDGRTLRIWTDNAIGNPQIIPPGPCTGAYLPLVIGDPNSIGNPNIIGDPHLRVIDANGDGTLCAAGSLDRLAPELYLLDNPSALARAGA
jgi:hypothetical protein